ncbi:Condensin-2 complex subunit G2 [Cryptosporidium felis]|nr:Condensin-2 complex subunit G2 [Cryptosporidium felis]
MRNSKRTIKISEICSYNKSFDDFVSKKSNEELNELLGLSLASSAVVKNVECQIFISRLLSKLGIDIIQKFVENIKDLIPKLSLNLLLCYGKIFFLVWQEYNVQNNHLMKQDLEEIIQRTFCLSSIKLNPAMALRMRLILHSFHENRDIPDVNKLLVRLYDPIVWRYLSVANWKVRLNSTALLAVLFPLVDPNLTPSEYSVEMERQFSLFQNLLLDNHSDVRVAAINAVCRILTLYWEITPVERICDILDTLISKCIEDKQSPDVRIAVVNGINVLINNPLTQNTLKQYLVKTLSYLHDLEIGVRYHVAMLILKISRIEGIDYSKLISKKQILSRISKEFIIYQIKQSIHLTKHGELAKKTSKINENASFDQNSVFESLKVARVLAELLNPSIFNERSPKERIKSCYLFCDLSPIGMLGYFNSLSISVEETIGKNIDNSDLLRLAVLLITSTIENYKRKKITFTKAKILLASSKELLKTVFSYDESFSSTNKKGEIHCINDIRCKKIQAAVTFFTNSCNDELFSKIDPKDELWIDILQLFLHQDLFNSEYYPELAKRITSELWSVTFYCEDEPSNHPDNMSDTMILLACKWGLLPNFVIALIGKLRNLLLDEAESFIFIIEELGNREISTLDARNCSIRILNKALRFNEVRSCLSKNPKILNQILKLVEEISNHYIDLKFSGLESSILIEMKHLLIYFLILLRNEKQFCSITKKIIRGVGRTVKAPQAPQEYKLIYFELSTCIFLILNSKTIEDEELQGSIEKFVEKLPDIVMILLEINIEDVGIERVMQGFSFCLSGLRQVLGGARFESDKSIQETKSKIDLILGKRKEVANNS